MVRYPLEVLAIFEIFLMDFVTLINPLFDKHVQVRIHNLRSSTSMRNLNPSGQFSFIFPKLFFFSFFSVGLILGLFVWFRY